MTIDECPKCNHPVVLHPKHGVCLASVPGGHCGCKLTSDDMEHEQLKADLARLQNKLDKVKIAFIKYENEANHIYAWKDFTYSLHVILNIPTKE